MFHTCTNLLPTRPLLPYLLYPWWWNISSWALAYETIHRIVMWLTENIQLPTFKGKVHNWKCFWNFGSTLVYIQKINTGLHWNCLVYHWGMCLSSQPFANNSNFVFLHCKVSWTLKVLKEQSRREIGKILWDLVVH